VGDADFVAEFHLARQIEQERVSVRSMVEQAADLRDELGKLKGQSGAEALTAQLKALLGEEAPIGGTTPLTTLTSVSEWLDSLAKAVDGADAAPTPDNVRGFEIVSEALKAIEPRWKAFQAIARSKLPPVG
jgi:hypothetical protein